MQLDESDIKKYIIQPSKDKKYNFTTIWFGDTDIEICYVKNKKPYFKIFNREEDYNTKFESLKKYSEYIMYSC